MGRIIWLMRKKKIALLLLFAYDRVPPIQAFQTPPYLQGKGLPGKWPSTHSGIVAFPEPFGSRPRVATTQTSFGTKLAKEDDTTGDDWRRELPESLQEYNQHSFMKIRSFVNSTAYNIYVLGTDHVFPDSARDVRLLLESIRPDLIFLEICYGRYQAMRQTSNTTVNDVFESGVNGSMGALWAMSVDHFFATKVLRAEHLFGDMRAGVDYWAQETKERDRPRLVLGDRPIHITQARLGEAFTRWERMSPILKGCGRVCAVGVVGWALRRMILRLPPLLRGLCCTFCLLLLVRGLVELKARMDIFRDNENWFSERLRAKLKRERERQHKASFKGDEKLFRSELYRKGSTKNRVIIEERNTYMACKLRQSLSLLPPHQANESSTHEYNVVVVVGRAHVVGLCKCFSELMGQEQPNFAAKLGYLLMSKEMPLSFEDTFHLIYDCVVL